MDMIYTSDYTLCSSGFLIITRLVFRWLKVCAWNYNMTIGYF